MRLTHHAVEQFAARWGGTEDDLRALAQSATVTKTKTAKGQEIWRCGERGEVRLVIKYDAHSRGPICVTVLDANEQRDVHEPGPSLDELLDDVAAPTVDAPADAHLRAAAAELDIARDEANLASEVFAATRSFLLAAKQRLAHAKNRLQQLEQSRGSRG